MISIITVTFNAASTLEQTLKSIVRQTYRDVEIVAVDGGSTDGTVDIFKRYSEHLGTLISERDAGVYDAMNKGVRAAKGDILFFLNAQDTLFDEHVLEKVVAEFHAPTRPYIVFGDIYFTNRQNLPENELSTPPNQVHCYKDAGPNEPGICHQCIFYRRELFERLGGYDLKYRIFGDFDFNIRAFDFAGERYRYLPVTIANFDLGGLSTLVHSKHTELQHRENMELRAKFERMKAARQRRLFIHSRGRSLEDGGYYVQFFGIRFDWTPLVRHLHRLPLSLPFEVDFKYGVPGTLRLKQFGNPLNGVTPFCGDSAEVCFSLTSLEGLPKALSLKTTMALAIRKSGRLSLSVSINGVLLDTVDFTGYSEGETRDILMSFEAGLERLCRGKNTVAFRVNRELSEASFGLQGMAIVGLEAMSPISWGDVLKFTSEDVRRLPVKSSGLYSPEPWGAWLHPVARFRGRFCASDGDVHVEAWWRAFVWSETRRQSAVVLVNGQTVGSISFGTEDVFPARRDFTIPAAALREDGAFLLEIHAQDPVVPADYVASADRRRLSLALCSLRFFR